MPARRTRQEARQRVIDSFMKSLDRIIPADESVPMKGATFLDWENQVAQMRRAVLPTVLEERSALDQTAAVECGGHCPFCGSDAVYLRKGTTCSERQSPDGPVVLEEQHCRCRTCDGSFSPSGPRLGAPGGGDSNPQSGRARQPGDGGAGV